MRLSVVAVAVLGILEDLADDHRAILARVGEDLPGGRLQCLLDDGNANLLIVVLDLQARRAS